MFIRKVEKFLRRQGLPLVNFVFKVGELFVFIAQSVYNCLTPPFYCRNLMRQIVDMGKTAFVMQILRSLLTTKKRPNFYLNLKNYL